MQLSPTRCVTARAVLLPVGNLISDSDSCPRFSQRGGNLGDCNINKATLVKFQLCMCKICLISASGQKSDAIFGYRAPNFLSKEQLWALFHENDSHFCCFCKFLYRILRFWSKLGNTSNFSYGKRHILAWFYVCLRWTICQVAWHAGKDEKQ